MTTTFDDLIISAEAEETQAIRRREKALATVKYIHGKAKQEARAKLTPDENAEVAAAMETHARAEEDVAGAKEKIAQLKAAKAAEERHDAAMLERRVDPVTAQSQKAAYDQVARVGREERTYHRGNCRKGSEFLRDVLSAQLNRDFEAEQRLARHMQEERVERGQYLERAVGTGGFAGLVVPQYLTEMYAPAVAARRPFADAMTKLPLPAKGMTVNISRITTPTGVGNQATENTTVTNTPEIDDTLLTIPVQTAAGSQTLSRQAIDRGLGVEDVTMSDMQRRYATNLDSTIINQASTGLSAIAQLITTDDASPTGAKLYPKILQGASQSEAALLGQANPDIAVMHSRRWYWLQSQMVSTWPLIGQPGIPAQNGGVNYAERYGGGFRGLLPNGMAAVIDNNIVTNLGAGTNQDEIYVAPTEESYLWEDPDAPQFIRVDQAKQLSVDLVLYGYYAYTMARYTNSHQKLSGTALVTPAFT
ncbi:cell envelope integrity protein TolA [Micromonospora sp. NPDC004551]|uniref:cell envelope integrity protein TolA n=1 Tax=Micromonospora sp. NPDC004551 TaxID=3154284 RepID=UPI0033BD3E77